MQRLVRLSVARQINDNEKKERRGGNRPYFGIVGGNRGASTQDQGKDWNVKSGWNPQPVGEKKLVFSPLWEKLTGEGNPNGW